MLLVLRSAYIAILAFLLISPFVLSLDPVIEKPILIFAQDKSESVAHLTDSNELRQYIEARQEFLASSEDAFDVHYFEFGESLSDEFTSDDFDHRLTNYSEFLNVLEDRYENRNVSLLVMASDGLYNRGSNPIYSPILPFPLYTVALGDTLPKKDIWIDKVSHNKIAFLGNTFDVKIDFGASLLKDGITEIRIKRNGKLYNAIRAVIDKDDYTSSRTLKIEADEVGLLRFEVDIATMKEEVSETNNKQFFYIDVLEGQQEILILSASPHPDVAALKLAINNSKNFRARSVTIRNFDGNVDPFNLLIINQLPNHRYNKLNFNRKDLPVLYVIGKSTSIGDFNKLSSGLQIKRFKGRYNESTAYFNDAFQYFSIDTDKPESLEEFPPLNTPFGDYHNDKEISTLFFQQIGNVKTNYPLVAFFEEGGVKSGVITGEGLWRWRLFDYRLNNSTKLFDGLIQRMVQYLSLREDKSRFRIQVEPSYFENNNVVINAEYYDKAYELENEYNADFIIRDEDGNNFEYSFLKFNETYQVDLGKLKVGDYSWTARLDDGREIFEKNGSFRIKALQLEKNRLKADHAFLYNLSHKNGGSLIYPEDLEGLSEEILNNEKYKAVIHYNERMKSLISFKWLFFLLLFLFSTEWFIRKWLGLN